MLARSAARIEDAPEPIEPDLLDTDAVLLQTGLDHLDEDAQLDLDGQEVAVALDGHYVAHQVVEPLDLFVREHRVPLVLLIRNVDLRHRVHLEGGKQLFAHFKLAAQTAVKLEAGKPGGVSGFHALG